MLTRCIYNNFVEKKKEGDEDDDDEENPKIVVEAYKESDEIHISDGIETFNCIFIPGLIIIFTCLFLAWVWGGTGQLMYLLF